MNPGQLIRTQKDEGKEKHVPHIEIAKGHKSGQDIVRVEVGHEFPHPNTLEHHIVWIELYGVRKENYQVINLGRAACAPVYSNPNVRFQINQMKDFKSFHALAYCNIHGLWGESVDVQK
ncbi:MAG: desulfoferrodoxin family protein [Thermodesulfobacteriota bacterium]|nr:desulfoferrodoxin family protein [Thermodesulfobacteriota bacterium]